MQLTSSFATVSFMKVRDDKGVEQATSSEECVPPTPLAPASRRTATDVAFPAYDPSRFARMYRAQAGGGKGGVDDDWEM